MSMLGDAAGDQRQNLASQPDLSPDELWGERAQQLVDWVKAQQPPVAKKASICTFAMRKGWEAPTREGILKYCADKKLLVAYQAVSGPAFKIPMTPVFDQAEPGAAPVDDEQEPTPTCLCARTAPAVNYGCPLHDGAHLTTTTKETKMAKDEIGTKEAAELLGITTISANALAREGKIEARQEGRFWFFKRASVIAWRDKKKNGDPAPATRGIAAKVARAPKASVSSSKPSVVSGDLADDVRMLVRCVDRGWLSESDAFAKLRDLVA